MKTNVIDCLRERGFIDQLTSEDLRERAEKPMVVYIGFDPTADSLHLGNLVGVNALRWMQMFGHTPIAVLGGATGKIGDPSGRSLERPLLDEATIQHNAAQIKKNFKNVLDFSGSGPAPIFLNNMDWLSKFSLIDFLRDIGKYFRLSTMLAKESVKSRLNSEDGISFTEFSYQLLQAYDFYHLQQNFDACLEMGGSDQWGNITAGTDFIRKRGGEPAFGLTFPLITRSDGKKFGKSEGGAIWLAPERCSHYDFYQYLVRLPDADVIRMMCMLTFMDMAEIRDYESLMKQPDYIPNTAQKRLAAEVTRLIHGEEGLENALRVTENAAPGARTVLTVDVLRAIEKDIPHVDLAFDDVIGQTYVNVSTRIGFIASKTEASKLIKNGGAYLNNEKINDLAFSFNQDHLVGGRYLLLGIGKKKKMIIHIQNSPS